jgi:hypothetical protein
MVIKQELYDGDLIHSRFAYKFFKDNVTPTGNIVAFRAPMLVTDGLIDLEDSLSQDYIYSDDAINFCWEIPNLCPVGAVAFQRYFNTNIAKFLRNFLSDRSFVSMKGDDIMVGSENTPTKKASVSITYSKDNVALGHTGININAGDKAPDFAYSTHLPDDVVERFIQRVILFFHESTKDMFVATTKIIIK